MIRRIASLAAVAALVGGFVIGLAGAALADHWVVEVSAPDEAALGERIQLTAAVHDVETGEPVVGAELVFFSSVSFAGVGGDIRLGEATTNELGIAVFGYELRKLGTHTITVEGGGEPNVVSFPVLIGGQLHRTEPRIGLIPGAGGWIVTVVVAGVWVIMIIVGFHVIRVAQERRRATEAVPEDAKPHRLWLNVPTAITAFMVLVTGSLVALMVRSPNTHHNLDPEGYRRSAVAYVEGSYAYPDFGLAGGIDQAELGRGLFVTYGCAGCHGVSAEGTTTADSPAFATYDWLRRVVRNGQPGMPSYSEQELSDGHLNEIFAFLAESRADLSG